MGFSANLASLFVNIIVNSSRAVTNIQRVQQGLNRTNAQAKQMQLTFAKIRTAAAVFYVLSNVFRGVSAAISEIVHTAAELERTFTKIQNAAKFDKTGIEKFKDDIFALSERLKAVPTRDLQGISLAAAQAGITDPNDILKFTSAVAKASAIAENISAGDLAKFLLLLRSQFKGSIEDIGK